MPQINVTNTSISGAQAGAPTNTGTAFIVARTDAGPSPATAGYVAVQSITQYVAAFGARSSTSAIAYDWLDEFFHDGGSLAYVARETDSPTTRVAATLTLNDAGAHPTVQLTALTGGIGGNNTSIVVANSANPTFTATTNSTTALTAVSSFANIGVGTPVAGTGIPAGAYIQSVNTATSTATLSAPATATGTGVVITPSAFTIIVQDQNANFLESHGPYFTTTQLYADTTSGYVTFAQSAGTGFTTYAPNAAAAAPLAGGVNSTSLSDATAVAGLANFSYSLGCGTVALPGRTTATAWAGIEAHCQANNRVGVLDMVDGITSAGVVFAASVGSVATSSNASYVMWIQGSLILPGLVGSVNVTRIVPGSAAVAALRAQVSQTSSQNQAPCGTGSPLRYPIGFTTYYGPTPASTSVTPGAWAQSDINTMESAGINVFANYYNSLCLFGYVSPVSKTTDGTYWQWSAACERMALTSDCLAAMGPFLFDTIDGANIATTALQTALGVVVKNHWSNNALFGPSAAAAGDVLVGSPINNATTAQLGQLNAQIQVRISPYADSVNLVITTVPLTVPVV